MNSTPRVVLPVPAEPSTSTTLPRRRPPERMSSSPSTPVLTRSRSAMVNLLPSSRWSCAGKATGTRVAVLRLSLLQQHLHRVPSVGRRAHAAQRFQPVLGVIDFEDVHPAGGALVQRPFHEAGAEQQLERARDLLELIADVGGELLTGEDDARMPRKEEQQVQVARVP